MELLQSLTESGHEQVVFFQQADSGLKCIVALHSTVLGPALGGLRMWPYASEAVALRDVLRHSREMTYKCALAGLNLGGGKAVLLGSPDRDKNEALLRSLGRFIGSLGGRFIVAEDVGTNVTDMDLLREETRHVVGVHQSNGGAGDPSPFTALGTFHGIRACLEFKFGHADFKRASFAVQGAGQMGSHLIKHLREAGAKVFVTDLSEDRVEQVVDQWGAEAVPMSEIYDVEATVFSPCALSAVINEDTLPRLRCQIVAGGANHQLESDDLATQLEARGILYAPDYAINAGGLLNSAVELEGYSEERALRRVVRIHDILAQIFKLADRERIPSWQAARKLAEQRLQSIARVKLPFVAR